MKPISPKQIPTPVPQVPLLGEALHFLRVSGVFYCRSELTAPWGLALPEMKDCLMFHAVTSGRCWLEVQGEAPRLLQPGDFALVPYPHGHSITSEPGIRADALFDLPREQVSDRFEILRHGRDGAATHLVCGAVRLDHSLGRHLVGLLPPVISIDTTAGTTQFEWMQSTLRFLAVEASALRPGGETVITRLADILVIQAIRSWMEHDPAARTGWFAALQDRQIGRAISRVHREPERPWTLESLALEAGMSRSAFAARFSALVGEPAMQYVARWRMQVAAAWLQEKDIKLADMAARLGYGSEAAFNRAFKRLMGVSPGAVRNESSKPS